MDTEATFRDLLEDIAKENGYKDYNITIRPVSSGGSNYTTVLYTATISAEGKDDLELFGKVAMINDKMREEFSVGLYDVERIVYKELIEIYKKLESKNGIPEEDRLVVPKFFGCNSEVKHETVVLENLTAAGFTLHNRMKSVDWPYAVKSIEALAKFHALSMCYAEEYPDSFQRHCDNFKSLLESLFEGFKKAFSAVLQYSITAVREENKEKLKAYLDNEDNIDFRQVLRPERKTVLIHGDYRPSNLMHRNNDDGSVDVIPVDFQTMQPGSVIADLLYFIFTGTDGAFRRKYYTRLIEHYYGTLSRLLRSLGHNPEKIYPREDFDYELQKKLPFGLAIAAFSLPMVTIEVEDAPNFADESFDMDNIQFKTGKLFPQRINEVVDDLIEWGAL